MTLSPPPTRTACEAALNSDWGAGGPAGLPVDNFSVRWTGRFNFAAGTTKFTARADDGIRVFLDGVAIIDQFHDQPATTYTATVNVAAEIGRASCRDYECGGDAVAQVSWTTTGGTQPPTLTTLTINNATAGHAHGVREHHQQRLGRRWAGRPGRRQLLRPLDRPVQLRRRQRHLHRPRR